MPRSTFGSAYQIERAIALRQEIAQYPCACRHCRGGRMRSIALIAKHHRIHGRDPNMLYPVLTEDGRNIHGPTKERGEGEEEYTWRRGSHGGERFVWPRRTKVQVDEMVRDAFTCADDLHNDMEGGDGLGMDRHGNVENDMGGGDGHGMDRNGDVEDDTMGVNMIDMEQLI